MAYGEAFLGGSWEENIVNNTEITQAAAWLPVHMGNVGLGGFQMSRIFGMLLSFGIIAAASATSAWAIAPLSGEKPDIMPSQSLIIPVKQLTSKQKCRALNRCRQKYTHCENKLTSLHKLADLDEKCVKPYQKCINSNFSGGEWFFTRWFNPSYLDCRQY